jgi:hypothetical protein
MASLRWYMFIQRMHVFIEARNYEWFPYLHVSYMDADDENDASVEGSHS